MFPLHRRLCCALAALLSLLGAPARAALRVRPCDAAQDASQQWTFLPSGRLQSALAADACLATSDCAPASQGAVGLAACDSTACGASAPNLRWALDAQGRLSAGNGSLCLTLAGGDGPGVNLWPCAGAQANGHPHARLCDGRRHALDARRGAQPLVARPNHNGGDEGGGHQGGHHGQERDEPAGVEKSVAIISFVTVMAPLPTQAQARKPQRACTYASERVHAEQASGPEESITRGRGCNPAPTPHMPPQVDTLGPRCARA